MFIVSLLAVLLVYDLYDFLIYGIISSLVIGLLGYAIIPVVFISNTGYYIICEFCRIRFKSLNNSLKRNFKNLMIEYRLIDDLIIEHNNICQQIKDYNRFWSRYYMAITYVSIPGNILLLHQLFFGGSGNVLLQMIFLMAFVSSFVNINTLNLLSAAINREANKSYKNFIQFKNHRLLRIRQQLNVSNYTK